MIGVTGKQYGLVMPKGKPAAALKSIFNADDDDTAAAPVNTQLAMQQSQKTKKQFQDMHDKALQEDPTIFAYDEVVDGIQGAREDKQLKRAQEQAQRHPKYIHQLMDRAKVKKLEDDLVYGRQLAKERTVDEHLYGDKEKFMTAGYKQQLIEQEKFKADLAKKAAEEEKNAVEKRGNMAGFYANLLNNNENMGGARKEGVKPEGDKVAIKKEPGTEGDSESGHREHERRRSRSPERRRRSRSPADRPERSRSPGERGGVKKEDPDRSRERSPGGTELPWKRFKYEYAEKKQAQAPKQLPRLGDDELAAARERYLKRKAEREAAAHAA